MSQHFFRTPASKLFEVMDHVHLVEVSEIVSDLGPGSARVEGFVLERCLESSDPGEELRAHTHAFMKKADQLTTPSPVVVMASPGVSGS